MSKQVLVIGYGNPGRLDDGLGPALAERMRRLKLPQVTVESNYQLNVEDASQIAEHDVVIFADASTDAEPPFTCTEVLPEPGGLSFSSHSVSASQVLGMVRDLFHAEPNAWMLAIRGYRFNEFGEALSDNALKNLDQAVIFLEQKLREEADG